jgi:hypothetical protein
VATCDLFSTRTLPGQASQCAAVLA